MGRQNGTSVTFTIFQFRPSFLVAFSFPPASSFHPLFFFPPLSFFPPSSSYLPLSSQSMESIATTACHKISDYMTAGRELWHIRTFTPLVEPPSTTVVGHSFVARHRKTSGRTETGSIFASGKFECSDYWLQGHGTQGSSIWLHAHTNIYLWMNN